VADRRIAVLPPDVAERVAAGEVIQRPGDVVKELVENAIDGIVARRVADPDGRFGSVSIELRGGGLEAIRIVDDGCGIPPDDLAVAFARHGTSKLRGIDDLDRVETLGFRGEALPSIAAVADLAVVTRTPDAGAGASARVAFGAPLAQSPRGCPIGTQVTVRSLFQNLPARLAFQRTPAGEAAHVAHLLGTYAMAYPELRFDLTVDTRRVLQTGGGTALDVLGAVYGASAAGAMLSAEMIDSAGVTVRGLIGSPDLTRARRGDILLFVNRRPIQNRSLTHAVVDAYRGFLPEARFPLVALHILLDPAEVDVNVHPSKAEVRFRRDRLVYATLQRAIRAALLAEAPPPAVASPLRPAAWSGAVATSGWATPGPGWSSPSSASPATPRADGAPEATQPATQGAREPDGAGSLAPTGGLARDLHGGGASASGDGLGRAPPGVEASAESSGHDPSGHSAPVPSDGALRDVLGASASARVHGQAAPGATAPGPATGGSVAPGLPAGPPADRPLDAVGWSTSATEGGPGTGTVSDWSTATTARLPGLDAPVPGQSYPAGASPHGFAPSSAFGSQPSPFAAQPGPASGWAAGGSRLPVLRIVGQVQGTYIVCEGPDGVYFVDQHAAHERILYEEVLAQRAAGGVSSQRLLEPGVVELTARQASLLEAHAASLTGLGYEAEPFGDRSAIVRAVPSGLKGDPARALVELLEALADPTPTIDGLDRPAATVACHAAIRAGDPLSPDLMRELIQRLELTDVGRFCPHGRPTVVRLPVAQLERDFGRR
jgi:DNA mismatch repair protein MutL